MTHESNGDDGIIRALREILETIAAAEEERRRHGRGSTTLGGTRLGYEFSIGAGSLSEFEPGSPQPRHPSSTPSDRAIAVRHRDGDVLVTIDVPEADPENVSAGVDDGELLLGIDGVIEERVPFGRRGFEIVTASVTNGVLELRLQPTGEIKE